MNKKSLLVLSSTYPRWAGDSEPSFVHQLCVRLLEQYRVRVICPHALGASMEEVLDGVSINRFQYAPERLESLVQRGGILANLKQKKWKWILVPLFFISELITIVWAIKKFKPDVIHAHWLIPQGLALCVASLFIKIPPVLLTSHGADLFALRGYLWAGLRAWVTKRFQQVTVVSQFMKDRLIAEGENEQRIRVVSMGVALDELFVPTKENVRNPATILFVGRLVEKKGVLELIEIFSFVKKLYSESELIIIGDGPLRERIQQEALDLKLAQSVKFIGGASQHALVKYYQQATVFVAPFVTSQSGDQEGLGLVSLEAIGCLCPVLVGDVPAVYDIFGNYPEFIFDPHDPLSSASKIVEVFEHRGSYHRQLPLLREECLKKYSWTAIGERYGALLQGLINSEGRASDR